MTLALAEIFAMVEAWLVIAIAVFLRVGATFVLVPGVGESFVPGRVRLAAALAFTAILTPAVAPELSGLAGQMPPLRFFLTELVAGFLIGIGLRLIVMALQMAGAIAAMSTSLAQFMGGAAPDPQPAIGAVMMLAGLALAVATGLHVHLTRAFLVSYEVLPAGTFPLARDAGAWGAARVGAAFSLAFSLAAPFLIASLLYNLMLGVVSKAMPQLMVAFVGAPAISWGALVLLLLTLPALLPIWLDAFHRALAHPFGAL